MRTRDSSGITKESKEVKPTLECSTVAECIKVALFVTDTVVSDAGPVVSASTWLPGFVDGILH